MKAKTPTMKDVANQLFGGFRPAKLEPQKAAKPPAEPALATFDVWSEKGWLGAFRASTKSEARALAKKELEFAGRLPIELEVKRRVS